MQTTIQADTVTVKITANDKGNPAGKARRRGTPLRRRPARRAQADRLRDLGAPR